MHLNNSFWLENVVNAEGYYYGWHFSALQDECALGEEMCAGQGVSEGVLVFFTKHFYFSQLTQLLSCMCITIYNGQADNIYISINSDFSQIVTFTQR